MLILSGHDIDECLPMEVAIAAMREAFAAVSSNDIEMPERVSIPLGDGSKLALFMPAYVKNSSSVSVKSVTFIPDNGSRGLPSVQSIVQVFDSLTGSPVALIDGSRLTAIRTAAAGGASVQLLARANSHSLAMLGSGTQARAGIEAACNARDIQSIRLFSPTEANARKLADDLSRHEWCPAVRVTSDPDEAVRGADIVWTATTSSVPTFSETSIIPGTHIVGVGSFQPSMIEISPSLFKSASIFVDQVDACWSEAGEVIAARAAGFIDPDDVHELGAVELGDHPGRDHDDEVTIFKSVGIAIQDAVASTIALDAARSRGVGVTVSM
ncbi:MAG: ornithine cyclodeaminase [Acidimicrobiaceae bacterium]|jgi:ornithine cyclodeaminase|nr:ornithine cyclodeaminase [Acidimicrobiaceae bacterium]